MSTRIGAIVMIALLALYLGFVMQYALLLIGSAEPAAKAMGVALIVLPLLGVWALVAELVFLRRGQRLLGMLDAEGRMPDEQLPRLPSGRPEPTAADAAFPKYQAEVEADPSAWQAWMRLGLAYDASGDRKRARWATRRAIALERASRQSTDAERRAPRGD